MAGSDAAALARQRQDRAMTTLVEALAAALQRFDIESRSWVYPVRGPEQQSAWLIEWITVHRPNSLTSELNTDLLEQAIKASVMKGHYIDIGDSLDFDEVPLVVSHIAAEWGK